LDILSEADHSLFHQVTGGSIEEDFTPYLFDARKFLDLPELNARGLQVARALFHNRVFENQLPKGAAADFYHAHGYLEIPDFLSSWERKKLRWAGRGRLREKLRPYQNFLRYCRVEGRIRKRQWVHKKGDYQYNFHQDIFFPTMRFWYSEQGVPDTAGRLQVSPGSCFPSLPLLTFLYDVSNATAEERPRYYRAPKTSGSPRLFCDEPDQAGRLVEAGFAPAVDLMGKANTLYIMDCRLMHRRAPAPPGAVRSWYGIPSERCIPNGI
jgi:hypothetical protein